MSSYIGYTPTFQVDTSNQLSDQIISIVSGQAQYTLSFAPTSDNLLIVSVNGTFYVPTVDYYIESNKITFINVAFPSSGTVYIYYLGSNYFRLNTVTDSSIQVNHLSSQLKLFQSQIFTGDSTTTQFTLTFTPGSAYAVLVLLNNVLQKPSVHYNIIDKTLIFVTAPVSGAEIVIRNLGFKGTEETYTIPSQYIVEDMLSPQSIGTIALKDSAVTTIKVADANITFPKLSSQLINDLFFYEIINTDLTIDNTKSRRLLVDTSVSSISINLPSAPVIGQLIEILDAQNTFDQYVCNIIRNGNNINGKDLNVIFYKLGVHCKLIFIGNNNWKLVYYDEGTELIGIQNMIKAAIEGRYIPEGSLFFSTMIMKSNFPWIYTVSSLPISINSYQTVSITYLFKQNSVTFGDLGSNILPTISALISDGITPITFTFNPSTSTDHTLVFDFMEPSGMASSFFHLVSYDPGSYRVQVNNLDFNIVPLDQNITFVMTVQFYRNTINSINAKTMHNYIVAVKPWCYGITASASSLTSGQTLTISINSDSQFIITGTGSLPTLSFILSDTITTKFATLNTTTSTTSSLKFNYTIPPATTTTGIQVHRYLQGNNYTILYNGIPFTLNTYIPLAVNFT